MAVEVKVNESKESGKIKHKKWEINNEILSDEIKEVQKIVPPQHFLFANDIQCAMYIKYNHYRCLKLNIHILNDYPQSSVIPTMTSDTLCNKLIKQLNKGSQKIIKTESNKPHLFKVVKSLHDIISNNKLVMCYNEILEIKKLFKKDKSITLKINETKGTIKFKMKKREYMVNFTFNIPDLYPLQPCIFTMKSSYPKRYENMYASQAKNLTQKLSQGFDIDYVFNRKVIIKSKNDKKINKVFLDNKTMVDIRNDIKIMNKVSHMHNELRDIKSIRYKLRKMNKQALQEQNNEMKKQKELNNNTFIDPNSIVDKPKNSLLPCIQYMVLNFSKLPDEVCQGCKKNVFPDTCQTLQKWENEPKKYVNKKNYPQRVNCGHWFHHKCLQTFIYVPPFAKKCPKCVNIVVKHTLFEDDVKILEKQWAVEQANKQQLDDVDDFCNDLF